MFESESEERQVVRAAREGSEDAQARLLEACEKPLRSFLKKKMGAKLQRHLSVSDLSQEVFAQVFRAMDHLVDDATLDDFKALLFRNADWISMRRGQRAQRFTGESIVEAFQPEEARPPAASMGPVTRADEMDKVHRLIDSLDEKYSSVLRLRMKGESFAEIARALGLTEDNARKRCLRASQKLTEKLQG